jgi:TonB family protein
MLARAVQKQAHGPRSLRKFFGSHGRRKIQPKLNAPLAGQFPMINKSLLFAALTGVAVTASAFAFPANDTAKMPAPRPIESSVVKLTGLPREFTGAVVNVEFTLDPSGQPRDIKVLRVNDAVLKRQVVAAFSQWRFTADAVTGTKRFVLPLEIRPEDV